MISTLPDAPLWVAAILAVAAATASWRKITRGPRDFALWLQLPAAALLYLALFPPNVTLRSDSLSVMTAGAAASQHSVLPGDVLAIALPDARAPAQAEAVPDLATALRRHPGVSRLAIIGAGLSARDRAAVGDRTVTFQPAPEHGLLELRAPDTVPLGRQWSMSGRAAAGTRRVELLDPSGSVVDKIDIDQVGRFSLSAAARAAGSVRFELRLLGDKNSLQDTISIPLVIVGGTPMSVIVRSGAVNPELKYWRRWASDAGLTVGVSASLSEGVTTHAGDAGLTAAALAQADLVMLDERAWAQLDASEKSALRDASEQGLGLLLRANATPTAETAADWRELGFTLSTAKAPTSVTIDRYLGLHDRAAFTAAKTEFSSPTSVVQIQADDGEPVLSWHTQGRGRIALWRLVDSYRLVLLGEQARYGALWASTLELLARPRGAPAATAPRLPQNSWVMERSMFCNLGKAASVATPLDESIGLTVDAHGCAAYWPAAPGWHSLRTAGSEWPFYVRAASDGRTLRTAMDAAATASLASRDMQAPRADALFAGPASILRARMASWPWLVAWLSVTGAMWWWERRYGKASQIRGLTSTF